MGAFPGPKILLVLDGIPGLPVRLGRKVEDGREAHGGGEGEAGQGHEGGGRGRHLARGDERQPGAAAAAQLFPGGGGAGGRVAPGFGGGEADGGEGAGEEAADEELGDVDDEFSLGSAVVAVVVEEVPRAGEEAEGEAGDQEAGEGDGDVRGEGGGLLDGNSKDFAGACFGVHCFSSHYHFPFRQPWNRTLFLGQRQTY